MDKLSYALGLSMAQNFKGSGIQSINADDFADALRAVYEDREKKMTFDEAKKVVQDFFTELEANAGAMNEELGKKFLEQNAQQEGVKVTESGLQYLVLKEGNGVKPGPNDAVTVHYTGRLIDGTVFDSSVQKGVPFECVIGTGRVIKGWDLGVLGSEIGKKLLDKWGLTFDLPDFSPMKVGGRRQLIVPAYLGYGERAVGKIPPNSDLTFEIELLEVKTRD